MKINSSQNEPHSAKAPEPQTARTEHILSPTLISSPVIIDEPHQPEAIGNHGNINVVEDACGIIHVQCYGVDSPPPPQKKNGWVKLNSLHIKSIVNLMPYTVFLFSSHSPPLTLTLSALTRARSARAGGG